MSLFQQEAKSFFERAKSKWQGYDNPDQVSICEKKINLCNDEIAEIEKNRMIAVMVAIILFGAAITTVAFVIVIKKLAKMNNQVTSNERTLLRVVAGVSDIPSLRFD
ncbi:MAG: hypothetical protein AYK19_10885 [Theionarchaea archaeon DG-70-1]|nr:MAG: hypothetical protein AYK19_10885 [Theionarchaea archaeon DG-70-1]